MSYENNKNLVLSEIEHVFKQIDVDEYNQLLNMICDSEKVFVVGVGRVMLMLQAFAKRLNHLGITANYVGAIDEPAITEKDLLIVGSGSGESVVPLAIMKVAKKYSPKIVHLGSNRKSSMSEYEDLFIRIPCRTKLNLNDEIESKQLMSSLFEQSLLLLTDILSIEIAEKKGIDDIHALWKMHANLE